jgi:hypothetical protein
MISGAEDFSNIPTIVAFVAASALVIHTFFWALWEQNWIMLFFAAIPGSLYLIGSTYLVEKLSRKILKKPFWAMMLLLVAVISIALFVLGHTLEMIGLFIASGALMSLSMWVYAYPIVRTHFMMRSLKWLSFKKGLNREEYKALCREKCGSFLYHPLAFYIFSRLVDRYEYVGKTLQERLNEALESSEDDDRQASEDMTATLLGHPEYNGMPQAGAMALMEDD